MKNMGIGRMRIAEPVAYDDPEFFRSESEKMAWGASDLLTAREEYPTLEAAVADAIFVAGTTSDPPDGHTVLPPRDLAPRLIEAARRGLVALLFGQERIGLTREAMARCQVLGSIPASAAYASLNLAQAALIFLYEIRLAALRLQPPAAGPGEQATLGGPETGPREEPPTQAEMEGFYERLMRTLDAIGFFEGTSREHMVRELRRIFNRALLTRREVRILEGVIHKVEVDRRGP
jgi:TrmH family RNA methyltransferase